MGDGRKGRRRKNRSRLLDWSHVAAEDYFIRVFSLLLNHCFTTSNLLYARQINLIRPGREAVS